MNRDTFHAFELKYLFDIQLRFKENPFCVWKHMILDIVLVVQFLVFVYFRVLVFKSRRQTNGIYSLIKKKCNTNSRFEIHVTSLCNASSNILQILS